MTKPNSEFSLSSVNYFTGISDGLLLPIIPCALMGLYPGKDLINACMWFPIIICFGSLAYGLARYFGEKSEIEHNHPEISERNSDREAEKLRQIGIDEKLVDGMMQQVKSEQEDWLKEVKENDMGWEEVDLRRAALSGLQTGAGFMAGSLAASLPFLLYFLHPYPLVLLLLAELGMMFVFGALKGLFINGRPLQTAIATVLKGIFVVLILFVILFFLQPYSRSIHLMNG